MNNPNCKNLKEVSRKYYNNNKENISMTEKIKLQMWKKLSKKRQLELMEEYSKELLYKND